MNINDSNIKPNLTFRRLVYLHMQQLTNFPYIEKDFDALTDYELLCLVVKYLNDVIANSNEQNTSITNLYNAFLELQTYMNNSVQELEDAWNDKTTELENTWSDKTTELETAFNNLQTWINNYFDNLDVQEEINNKLDQMLEDGVLEQIIEQFLHSTALWCFDNVANMKNSTNLIDGSYAKTLGYYSKNDGGSALYKIRTITNDDVVDEAFIIKMNDESTNLIAELIIENNEVNLPQIGGKKADSSNKYDNKTYIDKYIAKLSNNNRLRLYIPSGVWYFSPTSLYYLDGFYIYGDETFTGPHYNATGTIITTLNDNQSHLWIIGGENHQQNVTLKNLFFSTADFTITDSSCTFSTIKKVTDTAIRIRRTQYMITDNLIFYQVYGQALGITSSWELYFKLLNFRGVLSDSSIINFEPRLTVDSNISACTFENIMFEGFLNNLINVSNNSALGNSIFNNINIEDYRLVNGELVTDTDITSSSDFTNVNKGAIFNFDANTFSKSITINNINVNNFAHYIKEYNSTKYMVDTVFHCTTGNNLDIVLNNLQCIGMNKDGDLIYTANGEGMVNIATVITINNCNNNDLNHRFKFNLLGGFYGDINAETLDLTQQKVGANYIKSRNLHFIDSAYKYANNRYSSLPLIYSDNESFNNTNLVLRPSLASETSDTTFLKIPFYTKTLKIRAKIANGETASLKYSLKTNVNTDVTLTGTGEYKWYTIFENDTVGDETSIIALSSPNLTVNCYIDTLKFY